MGKIKDLQYEKITKGDHSWEFRIKDDDDQNTTEVKLEKAAWSKKDELVYFCRWKGNEKWDHTNRKDLKTEDDVFEWWVEWANTFNDDYEKDPTKHYRTIVIAWENEEDTPFLFNSRKLLGGHVVHSDRLDIINRYCDLYQETEGTPTLEEMKKALKIELSQRIDDLEEEEIFDICDANPSGGSKNDANK